MMRHTGPTRNTNIIHQILNLLRRRFRESPDNKSDNSIQQCASRMSNSLLKSKQELSSNKYRLATLEIVTVCFTYPFLPAHIDTSLT